MCKVTCGSCGVVVITSALHAEGHEFDPHQDLLIICILIVMC